MSVRATSFAPAPALLALAAAVAFAGAWVAPGQESRPIAKADEGIEFDAIARARIARLSPLGAPPADPTNAFADDPRAAVLGHRLFFDTQLGGDSKISCAHCHDPERAFSDGKTLAEGVGRATRNAPGLINVAHQRWFFWDGRADSLWAQALQPIENPVEMAGDRVAVVHRLAADETLRREYEAIFGALPAREGWPRHARPDPKGGALDAAWSSMREADRERVDRVFANVGKALAAYQRKLVGGTSAFDRFARGLAQGDAAAIASLEPAAQRGLALFLGKGNCRTCHSGPLLSDGEFHDLQLRPFGGGERVDPARLAAIDLVLADPFNALGPHSDDRGPNASEHLRFLARGSELWGAIRTPTLRNVARTAPYMDQGQLPDLRAVLRFYSTREGAAPAGHHQESVLKPLELSDAEIADLEAFLLSLTDEPLDARWLEPPP